MLVNIIAGALVGFLASALLFVLHFLDLLRAPIGSQLLFLALAFHVTGLVVALAYHRRRGGEGGASFIRLLGAGLMVSMVAGLVLALGTQLFVTKVDPSYIEWLKESAVERLAETPELSEEDRASHREQIEQLTPLNYAVQTMTSTLMSGFFLSITLAALFRMRTIRVAKA